MYDGFSSYTVSNYTNIICVRIYLMASADTVEDTNCEHQIYLESDYNELLQNFIQEIQSSDLRTSIETAKMVLRFIQQLITDFKWETSVSLYSCIKMCYKAIQDVCTPQFYVGEAVALHIKKICKDELKAAMGMPHNQENEALTMLNINRLRGPRSRRATNDSLISSCEDSAVHIVDHKDPSLSIYIMSIKEALEEFSNELDSTLDNICNQALDHIHTNEFILTMGYSRTLLEFFKNAARKRKFNLIIAECSPYNQGHFLAEKLSVCPNVDITIIPDSTIFAVMSNIIYYLIIITCIKVIISSYAVGVNGNLCASAGSHSLALAAHTHSVPLLVCCGLYKLVPRFSIVSPSHGIDYDGHQPQNPNYIFEYSHAGTYSNNVTIINPTFDDVPGDLVTLFITNIGAQAPNYIYRLMNDMYGDRFNLYPKRLV